MNDDYERIEKVLLGIDQKIEGLACYQGTLEKPVKGSESVLEKLTASVERLSANIGNDDPVNVETAARLLGYKEIYVRELLRDDLLKGHKAAGAGSKGEWCVWRKDIDEYLRKRRGG